MISAPRPAGTRSMPAKKQKFQKKTPEKPSATIAASCRRSSREPAFAELRQRDQDHGRGEEPHRAGGEVREQRREGAAGDELPAPEGGHQDELRVEAGWGAHPAPARRLT